ncbi:hypothetical protein EON82_11935 [bacterium]|nr:MAG: hypothetical protein EON82_11935 [bacterium]
MRTFGIALLLVAAQLPASLCSAQAPRRDGTFKSADGKSFPWRIDNNHSLVWNGERYVPVGLRIDGTPAAVDAANAAGIKDLLIDLPVSGDWSLAIDRAESNGQRYVLRMASLAPGAKGTAVDPAAYRIAGTRGPQHLDLAMPGTAAALIVVALKRDGSVLSTANVKTVNDRLVYDTKVHPDLETVVLIYPRTDRLEVPDFWDGLDTHRDALLAKLKRTRFGAGLRGFVNPLGRTITLPGQEIHSVPEAPSFRAELAELLQTKHTNVSGAMQAWSLRASGLTTATGSANQGRGTLKTTFADLARLVPLWSGPRGVAQLWDPVNNKIYACDKDRSRIWEDINEAVARTAARRIQRLCRSIRQVVDVPVVQEWSGWAGVTEDPQSPFDGIAARVSGEAANELADSAARSVSTVARWSTPGWLIATEVEVPVEKLDASLSELADLGVRAAFVQGPLKDVGMAAKGRATNAPADLAIDPVFFPENAANPAAVQRLPGGRWWLPTPQDGNRLDYGTQFFGYRIATSKGNRLVIWARTPGRYLFRMMHPEVVTVTPLDASDPDPKKAKNGLTLTLGQVPVEIECRPDDLPVPELALKETLDQFARLGQIAESGRRVGTDEIYAFTQAGTSFEANPGGSFMAMRAQLRRFAALLSPLSWVEAETATDTNFSEATPIPGASNGQALALRALMPPADGFYANYSIPVATKSDVELWVAAKIPAERRSELSAEVGGQTLTVTEVPLSSYGAGFAWYRLGTTRLSGNVGKVTLRMRSGLGAEAAIDTIVLAPSGWRPSGVAYPIDAAIAGR